MSAAICKCCARNNSNSSFTNSNKKQTLQQDNGSMSKCCAQTQLLRQTKSRQVAASWLRHTTNNHNLLFNKLHNDDDKQTNNNNCSKQFKQQKTIHLFALLTITTLLLIVVNVEISNELELERPLPLITRNSCNELYNDPLFATKHNGSLSSSSLSCNHNIEDKFNINEMLHDDDDDYISIKENNYNNDNYLLSSSKQDSSSSFATAALKIMIRINNMRAYKLALHSYGQASDGLTSKAFSESPKLNSKNEFQTARCERHLQLYANLMQNAVNSIESGNDNDDVLTLDALKLLDVAGKAQSSILDGSQFWLGSYESCKQLKVTTSSSKQQKATTVDSQYCVARAKFKTWKQVSTDHLIRIGMCLPASCTQTMIDESEVATNLVRTILATQLAKPFNKLIMHSLYCLPADDSAARQLSVSGRAFVVLCASFAFMCVLSSILDAIYLSATNSELNETNKADNKSKSNNHALASWPNLRAFILAFSIQRSLQLMFASKQVSNSTNTNQQQQQHQQQDSIRKRSNSTNNYNNKIHETNSEQTNTNTNTNSNNDVNEQASNLNNHTEIKDTDRGLNSIFLRSLAGIKCLGLLWIICAHSALVTNLSTRNLITMDTITSTPIIDVFLGAHLMVDSFFAISGLLASYLLFTSSKTPELTLSKLPTSAWLKLSAHRYWRLTPIYILNYWFAKAVSYQLADGPLWDFATDDTSPRLNCIRESWFVALFHLSDFKSPKEHCVPFAWFIANSIKFWLVTPIFVVAIAKNVKLGYTLTLGTLLANTILVYNLALNSNVDLQSALSFKPEAANEMLNNMDNIYTRPYSRIGTYLIGLLAGHLFYLIDARKLSINLKPLTKNLIWFIVILATFSMLFIMRISRYLLSTLDEHGIRMTFALGSALMRPIWALCTCWLLFALSQDYCRWLSNFLSARFWQILVKVSFCAYLAQGEVLAHLYLNVKHEEHFVYSYLITRPIVAIVVTIAVSFIITILIEQPMLSFEHYILGKRLQKSTTLKQNNNNKQQNTEINKANYDNNKMYNKQHQTLQRNLSQQQFATTTLQATKQHSNEVVRKLSSPNNLRVNSFDSECLSNNGTNLQCHRRQLSGSFVVHDTINGKIIS